MPDLAKSIAVFWNRFRSLSPDLVAAAAADSPIYDAILQALKDVDEGLWYEFSADAVPHELIISADGNSELFELVDKVVALAPPLEGWRIFALKPRLGFPVSTRWDDLVLEIADVVFEPLERRGADELGLRIYVPGLANADIDRAHAAILRAVDHGLGERTFAEEVRHVEVRALPAEGPTEHYTPLKELERYITWRRNRRQS